MHEPFREPTDTEVETRHPQQPVRITDHELDAAAAEVEAQCRRRVDDDAGADRAEDQARKLRPARPHETGDAEHVGHVEVNRHGAGGKAQGARDRLFMFSSSLTGSLPSGVLLESRSNQWSSNLT